MNRNRHLTFRCTQAEYNLVKQHCGRNMSEYIVSRLFRGIAEMDFKLSTKQVDCLTAETTTILQHEKDKP